MKDMLIPHSETITQHHGVEEGEEGMGKPQGKGDRFINVRCPSELREWARIYAVKNDLTLAEVVVRALREYRKAERDRKREEEQ